MAIPYDETNTGTSVRNALRHSSIKSGGSWKHLEDIHVKVGNTWQETKEVYVKSGGTWKKVHEGEHFLFKRDLTSNIEAEFNLAGWITGQGYSGNKIKGLLTVKQNVQHQQVTLGSFSSDSIIYLRLELNARIQGRGGNGGNSTGAGSGSGPNGQNGQRALYTRTPFILDNASLIAGGGGGGAGGENSYHQYLKTQSFPCQKGQTCYQQSTEQEFREGGGGGGGAGYPGGSGGAGGSQGYNGANGNQNGGGGGGGNAGGASPPTQPGGDGGGLGEDGANPTGGGTAGSAGAAIDGWSYRAGESGNGYVLENIRGPKIN